MHAALRSPLTAGIALCGASAIALTPIAPTMPALTEIQARAVSSAEVALTAAVNPIEQWAQVIQQALANGGVLAQNWAANPVPILRQLLTNQLGYGEQAVSALQGWVTGVINQLSLDNPAGTPAMIRLGIEQLLAGDFFGAVESVYGGVIQLVAFPAFSLLPLLQIPVKMAENFANVVSVLSNSVIGLGFGVIGTLYATVRNFGVAGQAVVDALRAGDLLGAASALVAIPGAVVGALLNGDEITSAPGLLSPSGLIGQLMNLANSIAVALGAVPAAPTVAPDTTLTTVSSVPDSVALSATTDTVETVTVSTTVTEEPVTEEAVAEEAVAEEPVTEEAVVEEPVTEEPVVEEPSATTETEATETGSDATGEATTGNGGTDLSDGNKAEPGSAEESGTSGSGTGGDETDSGTAPSGSTDADGTGGAGSSTGSGDSDSSGDSE